MGVLNAAEFAPWLLFGLLAGAWADRVRRRPLLIAADLGRALLLGSIPVAGLLGALHLAQLYAVAFLAGSLGVGFGVAYQAYLPTLVARERVLEGNSKLELSASVASVAGPGIAGGLVQLATAPLAIGLDALSYLASALSLAMIGAPEPPLATQERRQLWPEVREGLHLVLGNPLLRALAASSATNNFFANVLFAVYILYLTRALAVTPAILGAIFAVGSVGTLLGAAATTRLTRRLGLGSTMVGAALFLGVGNLLVPLAGSSTAAVPLLLAARLLSGFALPPYNINLVSLRQVVTPDRLQGRVNASMRFFSAGAMPLGALAGGALGQTIGLRPTLALGAAGTLVGVLWLLRSPLRHLRTPPTIER